MCPNFSSTTGHIENWTFSVNQLNLECRFKYPNVPSKNSNTDPTFLNTGLGSEMWTFI